MGGNHVTKSLYTYLLNGLKEQTSFRSLIKAREDLEILFGLFFFKQLKLQAINL